MRMAYADPPYPGTAARYYRREASFAGEVDHAELIARLSADYPDGWALSTSARSLRWVLPLCPESAHVCPWVKPSGVDGRTAGLHTAWEPLIVVGGRQRRPGVRDWLRAKAAIRGGTLPGRKPLAFCAFLFDALGLRAGDELADLYPGTGIVLRAWLYLSPRTCADASSLGAARYLSSLAADASQESAGAARGVRRHGTPSGTSQQTSTRPRAATSDTTVASSLEDVDG
jgi:hypothetical protein